MRVGKRLPKSATEISIHFKKAPAVLFNKDLRDQNVLVIRIQPDEGIALRIHAKVPGASFRIEPVKMDFHYGTSFGKASPEAYERLLLDAMSGDATLFARRDEVEEAWAFIDPIEEAWARKKRMRRVCSFIPPDPGARKRPTICSRVTATHGEDCERMPAITENYSLGLRSNWARLIRELKKLWGKAKAQ